MAFSRRWPYECTIDKDDLLKQLDADLRADPNNENLAQLREAVAQEVGDRVPVNLSQRQIEFGAFLTPFSPSQSAIVA